MRTALSNGDGTFKEPKCVLAAFCFSDDGWRVEKHTRSLPDVPAIWKADIVGFGEDGVWTALSNGDGTFQEPKFVLAAFGYTGGGWRVEKHPRHIAELTSPWKADIRLLRENGVWTALSNGDGTFQEPKFVLAAFGFICNESGAAEIYPLSLDEAGPI